MFELELRNAQGAPATLSTPLDILLQSEPPTRTFYGDPICEGVVSDTRVIPAGSSTVGFRVTAESADTATITAYSSLANPSTIHVATGSSGGTATRLAFQAMGQVLGAGDCSSVVRLSVTDDNATPVAVSAPTPVTLGSTPAGVTFYADAACTMPFNATLAAGQSTLAFHFISSVGGPVDITATSPPLAGDTQTQDVSLPSLSLAADPGLQEGRCSDPITVRRLTGNGSALAQPSATSVALTGTNVLFFADACCRMGISNVQIPAGGSQATFHVSAVAVGGTPTISASASRHVGAVVDQAVTVPTAEQRWWNPDWCYRVPLTVTTGATAMPAGYTLPVDVPHRALVTAGKALLGGDDLRIVRQGASSNAELDRVLDADASFGNTGASVRLWFKAPVSISANGSSSQYWLYYGNSAAGPPPANPAAVYLFQDGFESGGLADWTEHTDTGWQVAQGSQASVHSGTYSLKLPGGGLGRDRILSANNVTESDTYMEAWMLMESPVRSEAGLASRVAARTTKTMLIGDHVQTNGFRLVAYDNNTWIWLSNGNGVANQAAWVRVGLATIGSTLVVFRDGAVVEGPVTANRIGLVPPGSVGIYAWDIPLTSNLWVDDVTVRRLVAPEPTVTQGTETAR